MFFWAKPGSFDFNEQWSLVADHNLKLLKCWMPNTINQHNSPSSLIIIEALERACETVQLGMSDLSN